MGNLRDQYLACHRTLCYTEAQEKFLDALHRADLVDFMLGHQYTDAEVDSVRDGSHQLVSNLEDPSKLPLVLPVETSCCLVDPLPKSRIDLPLGNIEPGTTVWIKLLNGKPSTLTRIM